eukprot:5862215-Pyramimonas_sp.AAC.1
MSSSNHVLKDLLDVLKCEEVSGEKAVLARETHVPASGSSGNIVLKNALAVLDCEAVSGESAFPEVRALSGQDLSD